eukprot:6210270-Pleurochrysis_carterae.AAC.3
MPGSTCRALARRAAALRCSCGLSDSRTKASRESRGCCVPHVSQRAGAGACASAWPSAATGAP